MTSLKNAVGTIISRNTKVALWKDDPDDPHYSDLVWKGMAWGIPDEYANCCNWNIFGCLAETIDESNIVNINIKEEE